MTNGVNHPGRIEIGDLDMWSFAACPGASVAVTINEVPVGPGTPDPGFWPWIRLYNSAGALASNGSAYGDTVAQINAHGDAAGHIHPRGQHGRFRLRRHRRLHRQGAGGRGLVRPSPTTVPDSYTTAVNTALNVAAPGVLGNDISNGGGAMTAELVGIRSPLARSCSMRTAASRLRLQRVHRRGDLHVSRRQQLRSREHGATSR